MKKFTSKNSDETPVLDPAEKRLRRQEKRNMKAAAKAERRSTRTSRRAADPVVAAGSAKMESAKGDKKPKKTREKTDIMVAILEFPAKMMKDILRIKWIPKGTLGKRFVMVLIFLIFFAICYEVVDQILLAVFKSINFI